MNDQPAQVKKIYVWNFFIRYFHWNLLVGMLVGYYTIEFDYKTLHAWVGYYLAVLLFIRVIYLFANRPHTGFKALKFKLRDSVGYLMLLLGKKHTPYQYVGHNPAGIPVIIFMLTTFFLLLLSGIAVYAYIDFSGPLGFFAIYAKDGYSELFRETHEAFFVIMTVFISLHIIGVFISSILHKINLPFTMITGYKTVPANSKTDKI